MINVNIVCVGSLKEKYFSDAEAEYVKRLNQFCNLKIVEVKEQNIFAKVSSSEIEIIKQKEAELINKHLKGFVCVLAIKGNQLTSEELASFISLKQVEGISEITFVIGGSYGLQKEIEENANLKLSFSKFTFPHQLMRIILLEQVYRSFTILNNKTYHK